MEIDSATGEILNDPIRNIVNIKNLIDENKQQNSSSLTKFVPTKSFAFDFDSLFESGNLAAAIEISENEYDLILQNDVNTQGYI